MDWIKCNCGASYAVYVDVYGQAHITDGEEDIKACPECGRELETEDIYGRLR